MSLNKFEGDMENISETQLEFISEVLKKYGYPKQQVIVSTLGSIGDNYGSYVKRLTIQSENGNVFKIIVKIAPEVQFLGSSEQSHNDQFINEITTYNELLPKLSLLQEKAGVAEEDKLRRPLCYGALTEPKNEMLLLEDLNVGNYVMLDKRKPLNNRAIKIILQNLANYHSMSYVLRNKEGEEYKLIVGKLVDFMTNPEILRQNGKLYNEAMNDMISMFNDKRYVNVLNYIKEQFNDDAINFLSADHGSKYNIILHGDLWTNNIMFRIQDDQPVECIMIDYQLVRESLPVFDILNLIFACTDYETRAKHYHEWIDYYYSELDRFLNNFGLQAECFYPRDILDDDLKRYSEICLSIAIIMINFMLRQTQESPDMTLFASYNDPKKMIDGFTVQNLMKATVENIKSRIEGLIDSCIELGYLTEGPASLT